MVRAVRANNKVEGYQLAVYIDKPTSRLQIVLAALAADNNWKLCIDGALLSKHKVTVRYYHSEVIDLRTLYKNASCIIITTIVFQ